MQELASSKYVFGTQFKQLCNYIFKQLYRVGSPSEHKYSTMTILGIMYVLIYSISEQQNYFIIVHLFDYCRPHICTCSMFIYHLAIAEKTIVIREAQ